MAVVKVVWIDPPQTMLDERRRLGLDGRDEMWDGELHIAPPPGGPHQRLSSRLFIVVGPLADCRGLVPHMETGLFRSADDYRVPDQLYCRPEHLSERGAERAELVAEFRSLGDETYQKIDFYAACGVREMLVVHPADRRVELFRADREQLGPVTPDRDGAVVSEVLGIGLRRVDGRLRITWADGSVNL